MIIRPEPFWGQNHFGEPFWGQTYTLDILEDNRTTIKQSSVKCRSPMEISADPTSEIPCGAKFLMLEKYGEYHGQG